MTIDMVITILVSLVGGGGLVAIVQAIANQKKNKSEVTDINVKTAVELERMAMGRYVEASSMLDDAQKQLSAAKAELMKAKEGLLEATRELGEARKNFEAYRQHSIVLESILREAGIDVPEIELNG